MDGFKNQTFCFNTSSEDVLNSRFIYIKILRKSGKYNIIAWFYFKNTYDFAINTNHKDIMARMVSFVSFLNFV